jgi:hypothetical protein
MPKSRRAPIRKVNAAGLSGAAATIVLWLVDTAGLEVPAAVAAAITTVVAAGVGYLTPSAPDEAGGKSHRPRKPGGPRGSNGTFGRGEHSI